MSDDRWKGSYDRWKTRSPDDELYLYLPYSDEDEMNEKTEQLVEDRSDAITEAAFILIGMVRGSERAEGARATNAQLSLTVELTGGGTEEWTITIERTASSH